MGQAHKTIPYLLEFRDLRKTQTSDSTTDVGKILRVESMRYVYLVKKSTIQKLNIHNLIKAKNMDEMDYLISHGLKQNVPLFMLADGIYGELVNYRMVQNDKRNLEFHRVIENFHLWTNRYIHPQVSK